MAVKKKVVKSRVDKPFNNGTLSEAGFWSLIRSILRNASRWWKPIAKCRDNSRRAYKGTNKLQKWEYQCAHCKEWFKATEIAIDHKIEAGTLTCGEDLKGFIERLFCEVDGFQTLCNKRGDEKVSCHKIKTDEYMKSKKNKFGSLNNKLYICKRKTS